MSPIWTWSGLDWDEIRSFRTTYDLNGVEQRCVHESVFRSYQILDCVKKMLARGDSPQTVREFIAWAEHETIDAETERT